MSDILHHLTAALADHYPVERELGQGGMATVYLAEDIKHHRKVAIVRSLTVLLAMVGAACSTGARDNRPDSAAVVNAQSAQPDPATVRDSALATLATLLDDPASATFDSVVVVQPPPTDGRAAAPAVCGRIAGKPGLGGRSTPTRFVYQGRWTVFVEEAANQHEFAAVWAKLCDVVSGTVLLGSLTLMPSRA